MFGHLELDLKEEGALQDFVGDGIAIEDVAVVVEKDEVDSPEAGHGEIDLSEVEAGLLIVGEVDVVRRGMVAHAGHAGIKLEGEIGNGRGVVSVDAVDKRGDLIDAKCGLARFEKGDGVSEPIGGGEVRRDGNRFGRCAVRQDRRSHLVIASGEEEGKEDQREKEELFHCVINLV